MGDDNTVKLNKKLSIYCMSKEDIIGSGRGDYDDRPKSSVKISHETSSTVIPINNLSTNEKNTTKSISAQATDSNSISKYLKTIDDHSKHTDDEY
jgi:hypothetical protein